MEFLSCISVLMCDVNIANLSVRPSVRLSHSGILSKWLNIVAQSQ